MNAIKSKIQSSSGPDWRSLVGEILEVLAQENRCFSSGEISSWLRVWNPDLRFSVGSLGNYLRELFWDGDIPGFEASGDVVQVLREAVGVGRTPSGTEVYVYGPDHTTVMDHPFEVDIPRPGESVSVPPTAPAPQAERVQALIQTTANVFSNGRICLTRKVVEQFARMSGKSLGMSSEVRVEILGDRAVVRFEGTGAAYQLYAKRGRIMFPHPKGVNQGTFNVEITPGELTVLL